jgi:anti-sigma regulatory factor (Ser/Thr protein kinase)
VDDGLTCRVDERDGLPTVSITGVLSVVSTMTVSRTLRKELLDRGGVLVDVSAMRVAWVSGVTVFPTALAAAGGWPAARMALFGALPETAAVLRSTASATGVQLAADRAEALVLLDVRPRRVRRTIGLPESRVAAAYARSLVQNACEDWALPGLVERAQSVVNELVSNAVQHSEDGSILVLSQDARGLTVAVRDGSGRDPVLPVDADDERFGLRVVAGMSDNWGFTRHGSGKTVWALLRDD